MSHYRPKTMPERVKETKKLLPIYNTGTRSLESRYGHHYSGNAAFFDQTLKGES
jgi:hypothetical protein